jgi:hypothetical protein
MSFTYVLSPITLTYNSLRPHLFQYLNQLREDDASSNFLHDIARADRVCEVLLMGMRLCDEEMGSPEQINTLVDQRVEEICSETRQSIPYPLELYRNRPRVHQRPQNVYNLVEAEILSPTKLRVEDNVNDISAPVSTHVIEENGEGQLRQWTMTLELGSPLFHERYRSRLMHTPDKWDELLEDLSGSLKFHIVMHTNTVEKDTDYYETVFALQDAITLAQTKPRGVDPEEVWQELEESIKLYKEVAEAQREAREPIEGFLSSSDEEQTVEDLAVEAEAEDKDEGCDEILALDTAMLSPAVSRGDEGNEEEMTIIPEYFKINDTDTGGTQQNSPPSTKDDSQPTKERSNSTPTPARAYNFLPIRHNSTSVTSMPPVAQRFYRQTVQQTLDALLNSTSSTDVYDAVSAYWEHVEREVPGPEQTQEEYEQEQARRRQMAETWNMLNMPKGRDVNARGHR